MSIEKIEQGYHLFFQSIEDIQAALNGSFLDAYIESSENILDNNQVRVVDGIPSSQTMQKIQDVYRNLAELNLTKDELRKVIQFVLVKVSLEDKLQANHQLTPDTLGFLFVKLIEILKGDKEKELTLLDIGVGKGNLLFTLILELVSKEWQVMASGVDVDETLIAVAAVNAELLNCDVNLFLQDAVQPLLIDPVDIVVSDLPVGYYPDSTKVQQFKVASQTEKSYAHHLLIEQGMRNLKEDGYGLFLLPSNFLETNQSNNLKKWLTEDVDLAAIIKLPNEYFKVKTSQKSLVIFQKKQQKLEKKEVLLAELPSFNNKQAMTQFFDDFTNWKYKS